MFPEFTQEGLWADVEHTPRIPQGLGVWLHAKAPAGHAQSPGCQLQYYSKS